jgi:hypothetical protein
VRRERDGDAAPAGTAERAATGAAGVVGSGRGSAGLGFGSRRATGGRRRGGVGGEAGVRTESGRGERQSGWLEVAGGRGFNGRVRMDSAHHVRACARRVARIRWRQRGQTGRSDDGGNRKRVEGGSGNRKGKERRRIGRPQIVGVFHLGPFVIIKFF